MKTPSTFLKLISLLLILVLPELTFGQGGLLGSWKYTHPNGEMTMQIDQTTILINGQSFQYKAQGNVLMINEGTEQHRIHICWMVIILHLSFRMDRNSFLPEVQRELHQ